MFKEIQIPFENNCPKNITLEMLVEAMDVKGSIEREIYIKNKNKLWSAFYDVLINPDRDEFGFKSEKINNKYILRIPGKKITITKIEDNSKDIQLDSKLTNINLETKTMPNFDIK